MLKYKYIFPIKYTEAILSDSTRKLLWFEITKMWIAVLKNKLNLLVYYYNFPHTFVPHINRNFSPFLHKHNHSRESTRRK